MKIYHLCLTLLLLISSFSFSDDYLSKPNEGQALSKELDAKKDKIKELDNQINAKETRLQAKANELSALEQRLVNQTNALQELLKMTSTIEYKPIIESPKNGCTALASDEYGIMAKRASVMPIQKFFIIGERCSGTNYINALMLKNTYLVENAIGHKHFLPWYQLPADTYAIDSTYYDFSNTDDQLFIVIIRNAYDWLRSFHQAPHHAHKTLIGVSFSSFITKEWKYDLGDFINLKGLARLGPLYEHDPQTGEPFKNVIKLRTAKIETMLQLQNRASNVYYINYETVRDHPQEVLEEISRLFSVKLKPSFFPITQYMGWGKPVYPKTYMKLCEEDLAYINQNLDVEIEAKIKNTLITDPKRL